MAKRVSNGAVSRPLRVVAPIEREARQVQPDAAGVRPLVDDDVELEVLHRRVEVFLDGLLQTVDFVDEQHVACLEVGEQAGEVAGLLDGRAAGALEVRAHRLGEDVGERGLAEAGRAAEQDVVERFAALLGGLHGDLEPLLDLGLAGEVQGPAPLHDAAESAPAQHHARARSPPLLADVRAAARSCDNAQLRELGRLAYPMLRERGDARLPAHLLGRRADGASPDESARATPRRVAFFVTARGVTNEVYYMAQKAARFLGTNNVDNAARLCHSPSGAAMKARSASPRARAATRIGTAPTCSSSSAPTRRTISR